MPRELGNLTTKLSELEKMRQNIGSEIYSRLGSTLGEKEFKVLELIISNTKSGDKPWLSLGELSEECEKLLGIDRKVLNEALERLTKEELIRTGVSPSL
jgi:DNA topoisomerase IA